MRLMQSILMRAFGRPEGILGRLGGVATGTHPCDWYAKIEPDDLDAIVAYLRSLKPLKTE